MRCAECGFYECCMRTPLGGCPYGEKAERVEVITTTDTKPISLPNSPWNKEYEPADSMKEPDEYMEKMCNALISFLFKDDAKLLSAAQDLVDAVERYVEQDCLRSELLNKTKKLKAIINE